MNQVIKTKSLKTRNVVPYLYLIPAFVFLSLFTYYPLLESLYFSLFRYNLSTPKKIFIGFSNYVHVWEDSLFWQVLRNNALYCLGLIPSSVIIGLFLAVLINQKIRGISFYRTAMFYPHIIPMAAAAMIWLWLFTPSYGLINYYLGKIGFGDVKWLFDRKWALIAIIMVGVWKKIGYYMIIFLAGLQIIPPELYDAATMDGATKLKKFHYITLPLLSPTSFFVLIMAFIHSFQAIDQVYLMTRGGPGNATNLFIYYIYENGFLFRDIGYASTLTAILLVSLLILTFLVFHFLETRVHYE